MSISQAAQQRGVSPLTGQPAGSDQIRREIRQTIADAQRAAAEAQADAQAARHRVTISQDGKTTVIEGGGGGGAFSVPTPPTPPSPVTWTGGGNGWGNGSQYFIPPEVVPLANGLFTMLAVMVVGWPLARAFGRRLERKGSVAALPPGTTEQLQRIEQAVEAMAIEVERISESQRFMARLQKSSTAEPV